MNEDENEKRTQDTVDRVAQPLTDSQSLITQALHHHEAEPLGTTSCVVDHKKLELADLFRRLVTAIGTDEQRMNIVLIRLKPAVDEILRTCQSIDDDQPISTDTFESGSSESVISGSTRGFDQSLNTAQSIMMLQTSAAAHLPHSNYTDHVNDCPTYPADQVIAAAAADRQFHPLLMISQQRNPALIDLQNISEVTQARLNPQITNLNTFNNASSRNRSP